jgi:O-antigen ligase
LTCGAAAVLVCTVGFARGGWAPGSWRYATLALSCLTAAVLLTKEVVRFGRAEGLAAGSLAALAGWMLLSATWSGRTEIAGTEAERCVLYLAALLLALVWLEPGDGEPLLAGVLGGITVVSAWALGDYAFAQQNPQDNGYLVGPVWYANGEGAIAAIGIVLAAGPALNAGSRRGRIAALCPLAVLLPALALTRSWGAWGALTVVAILTQARRRPGVAAAAGVLLAGAVAAVWAISPHRVSSLTENPRWSYWTAAWSEVTHHPILGSGAGTFADWWYRHPRLASGVLDVHNLYLESLAELGPVGLGLVLLFVGTVATVAFRARAPIARLAGWAFALWAVHALVDWDWELPVVTLCAVAAGAAALVEARRDGRTVSAGPFARYGLVTVSLGLAVVAMARLTY